MNSNDLRILSLSSAANIVVIIEDLVFIKERSWLIRLLTGKKLSRYRMSPKFDCNADMDSIKRLCDQEYIQKGQTEEVTHKRTDRIGQQFEQNIKKDVYKITIKGKEKLNELLPEMDKNKVVNLQDFKNGNCPF